MATRTINPIPNIAIPPGRFLGEILDEKHITQKDLASRLGKPHQAVNEIVQGTKEITSETAVGLEKVLGVSAQFWLNLESQYQLVRTRLRLSKISKSEFRLAAQYPYKDMSDRGWVPPAKEPLEQVGYLCRFFGVNSLGRVSVTESAAFRVAAKFKSSPYALAAWLRRAQLDAEKIDTVPWSVEKVKALIPELRTLTRKDSGTALGILKEKLAGVGIALALVPHLPKTYANGAAFWVSPKKAVIELSDRGKFADIFWFSFFHELGHLLLHGKKAVFIDDDSGKDAKEKEADFFAGEKLIPAVEFKKFRDAGDLTESAIIRFARDIDIDPGVVMGCLHYEGALPYSHLSHLRKKISFPEAWKN